MPGETHFFPDIYAKRQIYGDPTDKSRRSVIVDRLATLYGRYNEPEDQTRIDDLFAGSGRNTLMQHGASYDQLFNTFMCLQMPTQKTRWGNNVPKDLYFFETILRYYPDAHFVICVRDIRDFMLSYQNKWKVTAPDQVERVRKLYHPVITSLLWKSSMKLVPAVLAKVQAGHAMVVPYEQLVSNPGVMVKQACDMIGEPFEQEMLQVDSSNSSFGVEQQGIFSSSIGRWREKIPAEHAWLAQRLAANEMLSLGYALEPIRVNPLKVAGLLLSTPIALWRALAANRRNTGPIIPYLIRRLRTLVA